MKKPLSFVIRLSLIILFLAGMLQVKAQYGQFDNRPRVIGWAGDTHYLFQTLDKDKKPVIESVDVLTGKSVVVPKEKTSREKLEETLPAGNKLNWGDIISPDEKSVIIVKQNDLYYFTAGSTQLIRLTNDSLPEMNARFSPDGKKIAFTRNKDLYVYDLDSKKEIRLTFDGSDKIYNGWSSWVYMEEILGRASRYAAFWWSPDGTKLAYFRFDDNPVPIFTLNRLDEADGVHGTLEHTPYPKPGDPNPKVKVGIADVASTKTVWVKTDDQIDQYFGWPFWTTDSKKFAVQVLNRDQNDLKIILADALTGDNTEIYRETRKTWIDFYEDIYVMKNGKGFIVRSYRRGISFGTCHFWFSEIGGCSRLPAASGLRC